MGHPPVSATGKAVDADIHWYGRNLTQELENEHTGSAMGLKFMAFGRDRADADIAKKTPPVAIPVILDPATPVASAADLQRLVEADKLPETAAATRVDDGKEVMVGNISGDEMGRLQERAEVWYVNKEPMVLIHLHGALRCAVWVERLKEGVTLEQPTGLDESAVGEDGKEEGPVKEEEEAEEEEDDVSEDKEGPAPDDALDVELAQPCNLAPAPTRASVRSRVSRILTRNRTRRERIPFETPIPLSNLSEGIVGWDSQGDPANPLNFPERTKWLIVGLLSGITLLTPFASSILAPGIASIDKEFGNRNDIVGTMTVSIYLLGYVIGPLFLAPLSELYGRQPVLAAANVFFCLWQIGCALAPSIGGLIVFRFLAGVGGSGCLTLGAGVIADVFRTHERGFAIGIYTLGPLLGPTIGPVLGSWLVETIGWRWDFWIVFIVAVVITTLSLVCAKETNPRILMQSKVKRLREELGRPDLRSCYDEAGAEHLSPTRVLLNGLVRPTKMLFLSPLVLLVSLYIAFTYGTLYLLFTTIPVVFEETYGWSVGITGLVYICLGLGNMSGWAVITLSSNRGVVKRTKANDGVFEPEMRLPLSIYFSFLLPPTFFLYGWATYYRTHWIVPIIGLFPFSFGIIGLFLPLTTYLVDCYPTYAASAIAANTVIRSLAGMLLPLAGPAMYERLGPGWGNSLLGFLCVVMIPVPMLLHQYGAKLRKMGLQL